MQRILSIHDFHRLDNGEEIKISSSISHQRTVRLRVNAPEPARLYLRLSETGEELFLARVCGLDEIHFEVQGSYTLFALGTSEIFFDTLDGTNPSVEAIDPESFTRIVERTSRNPELELIERKMHANMERRMAAMHDLYMRQQAEKEAARERANEAARKAAEAAMPPAPEQNADPAAPPASAGQAPSGTSGGSNAGQGG